VYIEGAQFNVTVTVAIGVIVIGSAIALTALIGFLGALWENRLWLSLYAVLIGLIVVGQIVFIAISYTDEDLVHEVASAGWDYLSNVTKLGIQDELRCCGFVNDTDRSALPCPNITDIQGCYTTIQEDIIQYLWGIQIIGFCLIAYELLMLILASLLGCKTNEEKKEQELKDARQLNREMNNYA